MKIHANFCSQPMTSSFTKENQNIQTYIHCKKKKTFKKVKKVI